MIRKTLIAIAIFYALASVALPAIQLPSAADTSANRAAAAQLAEIDR